jgi:lipid-binding SYLF domain-containing protein
MDKRSFLVLGLSGLVTAACSTNSNSGDAAAKRSSIDASVDSALSTLHAQVPGSRELTAKAKGVLVFPSVVSAGLGVGGSYGQGALRVGGRSVGYYSTTGASVGLLAGADSKAVFVLFMTQEALDKFNASKGWTAGADALVTMAKAGASASIDTQTAQQPVIGFALSNSGLMANLSLDGTKVNKVDLAEAGERTGTAELDQGRIEIPRKNEPQVLLLSSIQGRLLDPGCFTSRDPFRGRYAEASAEPAGELGARPEADQVSDLIERSHTPPPAR